LQITSSRIKTKGFEVLKSLTDLADREFLIGVHQDEEEKDSA
jgi:hypothetical protein